MNNQVNRDGILLLTFLNMRAKVMSRYCPYLATPCFIGIDVQCVEIFADIVDGLHLRLHRGPDMCLNPNIQQP